MSWGRRHLARGLALILLAAAAAACANGGTTRLHSVDLTSADGAFAFEVMMNGCHVYNAFARNRSDRDTGGIGTTFTARSPARQAVGTVEIVFPAMAAGQKVRAARISGHTGIFQKGRDARAGLRSPCGEVTYALEYF